MADRRRPAASTPLLDWGDSLRAAQLQRRRLRRRAVLIGAAVVVLAATIVHPPRPLLVWNASASAPIGLYRVSSSYDVEVGDRVIARVPAEARQLAASRHYIPANVPLVKRVGAIAGDTVCALGQEIVINGRWVAERRIVDGRGRVMPWWTGCTTLRGRALFLLTRDVPTSFDGRYFGPSEPRDIVGKATLLWRR